MFIAKVTGRIWSTRKSQSLIGKKLFLVRKYKGMPPMEGTEILMAVSDQIDAGPGDIVLVMDEGSSARKILSDAKAPVRTIIVGIIDYVTMGEKICISNDFSERSSG